MIELQDRLILDDGTVLCTDSALLEMLYSGSDISTAVAMPTDDVAKHDAADQLLDSGYGKIDTALDGIYQDVSWFDLWMTPEPYATMDVRSHCLRLCADDRERQRVEEEMILFVERDMVPVLRHLCFLVDHWRAAGILWGVGRGSSVSSFVLYLIGINRINPIHFDLDIKEFLK